MIPLILLVSRCEETIGEPLPGAEIIKCIVCNIDCYRAQSSDKNLIPLCLQCAILVHQ